MIKTKIIPQSSLTSDCWLVQFRGFNACAECPEYLGIECGGGETLTKMIHGLGDSIYSGWLAQEFYKNNPEGSFYEFMEYAKKDHFMNYGVKKYKKQVQQIKDSLELPTGLNLDQSYPFSLNYNDPDNEIISESSYHQSRQCTCKFTTKQGSYRDVIIRLKNGAMLYY